MNIKLLSLSVFLFLIQTSYVSAQDVEEIEAEFGHKIEDETNLTTYASEDKDHYGLTYEKFVPMLVKALQEADAKIDALTARIETLENA